MRRSILWVLAGAGMASATVYGQAEPFTYQGQLKQQGLPVTEIVDMRFALYDLADAETPIADPIVFDGQTNAAVPVSNGLFTVELDFGPGALQLGQWLEVQVRSPHDLSDIGPYTALTPRQHITAAPFALSVPGLATTDVGVEVEGNIHTTGEMTASAFSSNSPLIFKVNPANVECARFDDANCYLGLGTDAPGARLHVGGVAGVDGIMFPDGTLQTTAAGNVVGGDSVWSLGAGGEIYYTQGNVGVGTSAPNHRLAIAGGPLWTSNSWIGALELENAAAIAWRSNVAGQRLGLGHTNTGLAFFRTASDPGTTGSPANYDLFISDAGRVGVGTIAPASKLDITASGDGTELLRFTTERPWVFRQIRTGPSAGLQLLSTVGQKAFEITASDGNNVATFFADSGFSRMGVGTTAPSRRFHVLDTGLFPSRFEGTDPSASVVEFRSASSNNTWEYAVAGSAPPFGLGAGDLYFYRQGNSQPAVTVSRDNFAIALQCADLKIGHATRRGVPGRALVDNGDHLVVNFASDWSYTFVHGRLKTNILEVAGADLAEKFPSTDHNVDPGTVMEIDPENPGRLRVSREAYSSRVAGVVSGAGDIPMGAVLGNLPGHENAPAIALSGRVWARCDASRAAIAPGDLLTTSDIPGHAMKAVDRERSHGAVLGKAMTALNVGDRGLVLVLVNLQ